MLHIGGIEQYINIQESIILGSNLGIPFALSRCSHTVATNGLGITRSGLESHSWKCPKMHMTDAQQVCESSIWMVFSFCTWRILGKR